MKPTQGTYCTDKKYATYQLNNRTFFNAKIRKFSARSLANQFTYVFQVRIVKKKRGGGKSHTINYYGKNLVTSRTPDPRQGLYTRKFANGRKFTLPITPDDHREGPLFAEKLESFPGAPPPWSPPAGGFCPCTPPRGPLRRAPGPPNRMRARAFAHGFFSAPPLFLAKSWIPPTVNTSPPCSSKSLAPQRRPILGELGEQSPPPPPPQWFFFFLGKTYRFCPQ